jgi:hypothetical protein
VRHDFVVEYDDDGQVFVFYPLPADNSAVNQLKREVEKLLKTDTRLGRGSKRMEYVSSENLIVWDSTVEGPNPQVRTFGDTFRVFFYRREEAASFKLLYCADGRFITEDTVFL